MYSLIIFLPLIGAITSGLFGRLIGYNGAAIVTTSAMALSTLLSYIALRNILIIASYTKSYLVGICRCICAWRT